MLAELVDHVIGVDPDKEWITAAIVEARTTRLIESARFRADRNGYAQAVSWVDGHTTAGERVWAIEGAASYGRGQSPSPIPTSQDSCAFWSGSSLAESA